MDNFRLTVQCVASTRITTQIPEEPGGKEDECDENQRGAADNANGGNGEDSERLDRDEKVKEEEQQDDDMSDSSSSSSSESSSDSSDAPEQSVPNINLTYTSCIIDAELSPDGSCIFTSDYNRLFCVYPVNQSLSTSPSTCSLEPYARFVSTEPIWAFAADPAFKFSDSSTTNVLISRRDKFITLHNALWDMSQQSVPIEPTTPIDISTTLASYKLINHNTEAVTAPSSLVFSPTSTHFFAGTHSAIFMFDMDNCDLPSQTFRTSRTTKLAGGGRGWKGGISALINGPSSSPGIIAAGSRTRHISLYDTHSTDEITYIALPGSLNGHPYRCGSAFDSLIGDGITSMKFSPDGTYLYVAERNTDGILIYDMRKSELALGYCVGRKALTNHQKFGFDIWSAGQGSGHEVWAGGTDGCVRVWRNAYAKEGAVQADEVIKIGDGDVPVTATMVHESGSMAVAACGRIDILDDDDDDGDEGGDKGQKRGVLRGGGRMPRYRDRGSLDILGLT